MSKFKVNGLDELQKQLKQMERAAKKLNGKQEIPFSKLFTPAFMRKYTSFSSFDELMEAGGFHAETSEEFEAIPDAPFDAHVAATTKFSSWEDMLGEATEQYVAKQLGF